MLVDEQRWDGQERSTRYQNFKKSGYFIPDFGETRQPAPTTVATVDFLFAEYDAFTQEMLRFYAGKVPQPEGDGGRPYTRTLRAALSIIRAICCRWRPTHRSARS